MVIYGKTQLNRFNTRQFFEVVFMVIRFSESANSVKINTVIDDFSCLFVYIQTIVLSIMKTNLILRK